MNLLPLLVTLAPLLAIAAVFELAGALDLGGRGSSRRGTGAGAGALGVAVSRVVGPGPLERLRSRLLRAGLERRVTLARALAAKAAGLGAGLALASLAAPAAPGRLGVAVAIALAAGGFLAPDALLERGARRRRLDAVAALPDALDLLAVGIGSGRGAGTVIAELGAGAGPLAEELRVAVAEIESGRAQPRALAAIADRVQAPEIAAVAKALERSSRHGSPLAERLREQAVSLRAEQRRRVGESADRAAPKIQLAVALLLVPSVLLIVAAALLAHSGALLVGP